MRSYAILSAAAWVIGVVGAMSALSLGGTAGCGNNSDSDNPPDVSGIYALTSTECPGFFAPEIEVIQNGDEVTIEPTDPDFAVSSGTIENDGDFLVSSVDGECEGRFEDGIATASCSNDEGEDCDITFERN